MITSSYIKNSKEAYELLLKEGNKPREIPKGLKGVDSKSFKKSYTFIRINSLGEFHFSFTNQYARGKKLQELEIPNGK